MSWLLLQIAQLRMGNERRNAFEPFALAIAPRWQIIIDDQHLAADHDWDEIRPTYEGPGFRLLHDRIVITRVSNLLSYINHDQSFTTSMDIRKALAELPKPAVAQKAAGWSPPQFYIKQTSDRHPQFGIVRCLEFGLITNETRERSIDFRDDRHNIILARLPDAVFSDYYNDDNFDLNQKIKKPNVALLFDHYGWKNCDPDLDSPQTWYTLEHKYFSINYQGI